MGSMLIQKQQCSMFSVISQSAQNQICVSDLPHIDVGTNTNLAFPKKLRFQSLLWRLSLNGCFFRLGILGRQFCLLNRQSSLFLLKRDRVREWFP